VRSEFRRILRFWLDRGVDGFRVDVAHGLIKADGLPDYTPPADAASMGGEEDDVPYWGQPGVHDVYRDWHDILAEYDGDRALCAEAWRPTPDDTALWVRPDEMHQAFNFPYLTTEWDAAELSAVIDESVRAFSAVGAPSTWVLSNHDVVRHASRFALSAENPQGHGIGPLSPGKPIPELGLRRARAASTVMLALPGSAYIFQGEELGLPEAVDLPDEARQDPTWFRTAGQRYGRDGCRVPVPWSATAPAFGFSPTGASWLPQPASWAALARDRQVADSGSTLTLYRTLLAARRARKLGSGTLEWLKGYPAGVLAFRNGNVTVVANIGDTAIPLPHGDVIATSGPTTGGKLPVDTAVWVETSGA
jgi:alpha-glucosidase